MLFQLTYSSLATDPDISKEELTAIWQKADRHNRALSITGLLVFAEGKFIQVLEGDKQTVLDLYKTIASDQRNIGNFIIRSRDIVEREFSEWAMGFQHIKKSDYVRENTDYAPILNPPFSVDYLQKHSEQVIQFLQSFTRRA